MSCMTTGMEHSPTTVIGTGGEGWADAGSAFTKKGSRSSRSPVSLPAPQLAPQETRVQRQKQIGALESGLAGRSYALRTGIMNVNVEPWPNWLLTQILPPCSSTNFRHRVSPSPVPSTFLSAVPTWRNSSKTAS